MSFGKYSFNRFLRQPYPYYFRQKSLGKLCLGIFLISFFFIYLFEPFHVDPFEHRMNYAWISLLHVAVSSLLFYACFSLLNFLKIEEEKWNVGREILCLALVLLLMGVGNFLLRDLVYDNPKNWSLGYFLEEIRNTFMVGILIVLILVPLNFARIYSKHSRNAALLKPAAAQTNMLRDDKIHISTQLKADDFYLDITEFLFAKAEGNYVEFHLSSAGKYRKEVKRITMKDLEEHLVGYSHIMKTHRSYLVNCKKITSIAGNAQGYRLSLQDCTTLVPVSRGLVKKFDEAFRTAAL